MYSECVLRADEIVIDYYTKGNQTTNMTASLRVLNAGNGYQEYTLNANLNPELIAVEAINLKTIATLQETTGPIVRIDILLANSEGLLCPNGQDATRDEWNVLKASEQNYFTAYECELYFAALVYQGEVLDGVLHESEVERITTKATLTLILRLMSTLVSFRVLLQLSLIN